MALVAGIRAIAFDLLVTAPYATSSREWLATGEKTEALDSTHALESRFRFLGVFCFAGLPFVDMAGDVCREVGRILDMRMEG